MRKYIKLIGILGVAVALVVAVYVSTRPTSKPAEDKNAASSKQDAEKEASTQPAPTLDIELQNSITAWAKNQNGNYGIAVKEFNGKQRYANYQAEKQFVAASTYKLFVTYAILHDIEQGNHTLGTQTSIGMTVSQCIDAMLVRSNNDCGYPTGALIGWENLANFIHQQGFTSTNINNYDGSGNTTSADKISSPKDQADFMVQLANGALLNQEHTNLMLAKMKAQVWRERIPAGVPDGVEVADKPGWLPGIQNDTAVVYGPKSTYVISIMSTGTSSSKLAELSQLIYEYLQPSS
jgi:beta-lactamase class A